eukprot:766480-Hanusia_phi.AAC.9
MGLAEDFEAAAALAASGSNDGLKKISQDQQLLLYGWFKQVPLLLTLSLAPCPTPAAQQSDCQLPPGKAKWEAWNKNKGAAISRMSKDEAMQKYVNAVNEWKS